MNHDFPRDVLLALLLLSSPSHAGPDQSPPVPNAVVDLRTKSGAAAVQGTWRYTDVHIVGAENRSPGVDLRPSGPIVKTHTIHPQINTPDFDAAPWKVLDADRLESRLTNGRLAFGWYRFDITVPERIGSFDTSGSTIVLETVVDDYAEIWIDGSLPRVLGHTGGPLPSGWNSPSRVTLAQSAKPGQRIQVAIFAGNGPLSDPPDNFVWVRSATLDFYTPERGWVNPPTPVPTHILRVDPALDAIVPPGAQAERLAGGFSFVEGPVWVPSLQKGESYGGGGAGNYLLFSDPNKNVIHRWDPLDGAVSIFRTKSGYSGIGGADIGKYRQPGSNGLALSPDGRLTICEHGNRRVTRLEPNGSVTVLADRFEGKRFNSPNDLVYRSDGALFFTDPPYGLPMVYDDPGKELPYSGVFCLYGGTIKRVSTDLKGPNGLAFSPDERHLYVANWDEKRKVIVRYDVATDGSLANGTALVDLTETLPGEICFDGLKVDTLGNLYAAAPDGLRVYSPSGHHLGTITLPELPANFAFGDADGKALYITARTGLYRLRLDVSGKRGG